MLKWNAGNVWVASEKFPGTCSRCGQPYGNHFEMERYCFEPPPPQETASAVVIDLAADRAATWRVLGIDPEQAERDHCWLAPSVASCLDAVAGDRDIVTALAKGRDPVSCSSDLRWLSCVLCGARHSGPQAEFEHLDNCPYRRAVEARK